MTVATAVVADTQILIWYVIDPDRLSPDAVTALEGATSAEEPIYVSAHSLVELVYAVEKPTNPLTEDDRQAILDELAREDSPFEVVPMTADIANQVAKVPRTPRRMIVSSRSTEVGRLAGFPLSQRVASSAKVVAAFLGSIHAPRARSVRSGRLERFRFPLRSEGALVGPPIRVPQPDVIDGLAAAELPGLDAHVPSPALLKGVASSSAAHHAGQGARRSRP